MDEVISVLQNPTKGNAYRLNNISRKAWELKTFNNTLIELCNAPHNKNKIDRCTKGFILTFPNKVI